MCICTGFGRSSQGAAVFFFTWEAGAGRGALQSQHCDLSAGVWNGRDRGWAKTPPTPAGCPAGSSPVSWARCVLSSPSKGASLLAGPPMQLSKSEAWRWGHTDGGSSSASDSRLSLRPQPLVHPFFLTCCPETFRLQPQTQGELSYVGFSRPT